MYHQPDLVPAPAPVAQWSGPTAQRARGRNGIIFAVVALGLLMSSLDQTIVATALHTLQHDLGASITWASWTMTIYSLGLLLMLPAAGKLSEQYGRRRVFLFSAGLFTAASLCCGLVDNIYALVALRFVQALGGAGFTPSATGIIVDHFGHGRDKALGLFGSVFSIGAMIGPIFGGLFVTYWSWRGIFFVNVPIGIALIVLCLRYVPADAAIRRDARKRFDVGGMAELGAGVLAMMLALSALSEGRVTAPRFYIPFAVAVVALLQFARHIAKREHPFIAPRFLTGRTFSPVNLVNVIGGMIENGVLALVPLYATLRYGLSALDSGTLLTGEGAAVIIMSSLGAFLLRRTGYRWPIFVGMLAMVIGVFALALAPIDVPPYAWLALTTGLIGLGAGWLSPASRNAGIQLAPENAPTLAAIRTMCFQIGSIIAIAITTASVEGAANPGLAYGHAYIVWGIAFVLLLPVVLRIPEHRGAW